MVCFSEFSIASKMMLSVIIQGFPEFGNRLLKMSYLPTDFEMELMSKDLQIVKVMLICSLTADFVG